MGHHKGTSHQKGMGHHKGFSDHGTSGPYIEPSRGFGAAEIAGPEMRHYDPEPVMTAVDGGGTVGGSMSEPQMSGFKNHGSFSDVGVGGPSVYPSTERYMGAKSGFSKHHSKLTTIVRPVVRPIIRPVVRPIIQRVS